MRNKMVRTRVRTSTRKLGELVEAKSKDEAAKQYNAVASLLDRAVSKGVIHRNTAARKKSALARSIAT